MRFSHAITAFGLVAAPAVLVSAAQGKKAPVAMKGVRTAAAPVAIDFKRDVLPVITKQCMTCHGGPNPTGNVDLRAFKDEASVLKNRDLWERVAQSMHSHHMPPKGMPQPTQPERDRVNGWVQSKFAKLDCDLRDPGRVTLRRLNRSEYNNTVRDLLAVDFKPADDFPSDDVGYGFDNIGDVLTISPLLMERYLSAAEKITAKAIWTPDPVVTRTELGSKTQVSGNNGPHPFGRALGTSGNDVVLEHTFPAEGEYYFRVRAFANQSGSEPAKMSFRLNGQQLKLVDVPAVQGKPEIYEIRAIVPAGKHKWSVAFTNDHYEPENPDPKKRDRNLYIGWMEVAGPLDQKPGNALPEGHRRLFGAAALPADRHEAARKVLTPFLKRAFRRPVKVEEVERYIRYVDLAQKEGESFERGIQLAVQSALCSPHFLFRVELDGNASVATAAKMRPLNGYELASRLSYFLWSSTPDDTLLGLADQGKLQKPVVLEQQVSRMLRDPRAKALVENFGAQWLTLRMLQAVAPDPKMFPDWNDDLRQSMRQETELFLETVMREDRSVLELLDAKYTFLNERLAKFYGIPNVTGNEFRRVTLTDARRGGLLTHASILTLTSNPTRTSPVKRGKWVLEQVLGTPPPPAPPNVPTLEAQKEKLTGTLRQQMEQHRTDPLCASCHTRMDAIGFGLENFDAIGRWRDFEDPAGKTKVDATGTISGVGSFSGPGELKTVLKTQKDQFVKNLTGQMLTFALGRGLEYYDRCSVSAMAQTVEKRQYRFSALVSEIVTSDPFRYRRGEASK